MFSVMVCCSVVVSYKVIVSILVFDLFPHFMNIPKCKCTSFHLFLHMSKTTPKGAMNASA
jgi:hypothetical protein